MPDEQQVRSRWRVFVAHTSELTTYPVPVSFIAAATKAITDAGHTYEEMAGFGANPLPPADECARRVEHCDVYIGILGYRYGTRLRRPVSRLSLSYTEYEFDVAGRTGLPRLIFELHEDAAVPRRFYDGDTVRQDGFRRRAKLLTTSASFSTPEELAAEITRSLGNLAAKGLPQQQPPAPEPVTSPEPPKRRRKRWLPITAVVTALALAGALTAWRLTGQEAPAPSCKPADVHSRTALDVSAEVDGDCVGYRSTGTPFGSDARSSTDQKLIFTENECAQRRPLPPQKIVYIADLTSGDITASSQAEELEGLLMQQFQVNGAPRPDGSCERSGEAGHGLQIIVANGGAAMGKVDRVTQQLMTALAGDPLILGLVGFDRSNADVAAAIQQLDAAGYPVVTTTLSGDGLWQDATNGLPPNTRLKTYVQLVPSNSGEAGFLANAVTDAIAADGLAPNALIVSPQPADLYVSTLRNDLSRDLSGRGKVEPTPRTWRSTPSGAFPTTDPDALFCPSDTEYGALIYVGRHTQFPAFLDATENAGCTVDVPIYAVDAVSRYVDWAAAAQQAGDTPVTIRYITKAPGLNVAGRECVKGIAPRARTQALRDLCRQLDQVYRYIDDRLAGRDQKKLSQAVAWPGDRHGEDYDAVELLLGAAAGGDRKRAAGRLSRVGQAYPKPCTTDAGCFEGAAIDARYRFNQSRLSTSGFGLAQVERLGTSGQKVCQLKPPYSGTCG